VDELAKDLGPGTRQNNVVDVQLLATLTANAVDFFVTQDEGLHRRAARAGIDERVLFVPDAIRLIERKFAPTTVKLPYIVQRKAYELDIREPIFDSLREGYPEF